MMLRMLVRPFTRATNTGAGDRLTRQENAAGSARASLDGYEASPQTAALDGRHRLTGLAAERGGERRKIGERAVDPESPRGVHVGLDLDHAALLGGGFAVDL